MNKYNYKLYVIFLHTILFFDAVDWRHTGNTSQGCCGFCSKWAGKKWKLYNHQEFLIMSYTWVIKTII